MAQMTALDYDTRALRAAAQKLRSCAASVRGSTQTGLNRMRNELRENLQGRTADRLEQRLTDMGTDISTLAGNLDGIANAMFKYAAALERMARELRAKMQS